LLKVRIKKKKGYEDGIRGKGYVVNALEAALWAFYYDDGKFDKGVLSAINLGDDTDTTAAIYGELAGAVYGIDKIPQRWIDRLYQADFIKIIAEGLYVKGQNSNPNNTPSHTQHTNAASSSQPDKQENMNGAPKPKLIQES